MQVSIIAVAAALVGALIAIVTMRPDNRSSEYYVRSYQGLAVVVDRPNNRIAYCLYDENCYWQEIFTEDNVRRENTDLCASPASRKPCLLDPVEGNPFERAVPEGFVLDQPSGLDPAGLTPPE